MKISVGVTHITSNFEKLAPEVRKAMAGLIRETTEQVASDYKSAVLSGTRSGREYTHAGVKHIASAPGEAPASETGDLVGSVETVYPSDERGEMHIGSHYARKLEFGTKSLAPRPALRPVMAAITPVYRKRAREVVKAATEG